MKLGFAKSVGVEYSTTEESRVEKRPIAEVF